MLFSSVLSETALVLTKVLNVNPRLAWDSYVKRLHSDSFREIGMTSLRHGTFSAVCFNHILPKETKKLAKRRKVKFLRQILTETL